ncbi:MAG: hypothetical protein WCS27_02450 [Victivallaceae bacterium]
MEGALFETILLYFFIIPAVGAFIIMLLREKPKIGLLLTPVIATLILFAFMLYLDVDEESGRCIFDASPDMPVMISALTSFCTVAIILCLRRLSSDENSGDRKGKDKFPSC